MRLQILVPQYKETEEVIKPLLDSIAIQQNVTFEEIGVIICNDGSDVYLSDEFLQSYPFSIDYHKEEHRGVSGTRNACLDYATADYVMFCDADDMFYNVCGLYQIFLDIAEGFDTLTSSFVEETRESRTRQIVYLTHDFDCTFIHGKVHRRQYLIDKRIRFKEDLVVNEDSYFTVMCQSQTEKHKHCKKPFYLWKWRDDSVCRCDPYQRVKTYNYMIKANDYLVGDLLELNLVNKAAYYMVCMVLDTYFALNLPMWKEEKNAGYREETEKMFADYFMKYRNLWYSVPEHEKVEMSNSLRDRAIKQGMEIETISLPEWIDTLLETARRES